MANRNRYGVQKKQWAKWDWTERKLFNTIHQEMLDQSMYSHPKALKQRREHWKTTAWNAAWIAADIHRDLRKRFE